MNNRTPITLSTTSCAEQTIVRIVTPSIDRPPPTIDMRGGKPMQPRRLAIDLAAVTIVKLALLTFIYFAFFAPIQPRSIDMSAHIAGISDLPPISSSR